MGRLTPAWRMGIPLVVLAAMLVAGVLIAIGYARHAVITSQQQWCGSLHILLHTLPHYVPLYSALVHLALHYGC